MSAAQARDRFPHPSGDIDVPLFCKESRVIDIASTGLPAEGVGTAGRCSDPVWTRLAGALVGPNFGSARVEFVWPGEQGGRPDPAGRPPARPGREHVLAESEEAILDAIARGDGLEGILDRVCRSSDALFEGARCSILLADPGGDGLRLGAGPGLPAGYGAAVGSMPIALPDGPRGSGAAEEVMLTDDIASDPAWRGFAAFALAQGIRSCWAFPLGRGGAVHGFLMVHHQEPRGPSEAEAVPARRLARLAALSVLRKRQDQRPPEDGERLASAMQGASIGFWEWDIGKGTLYWSPLLKRMLGMEPKDEPVPGVTFEDLLHPDDRERAGEVLRRHLAEREPYDAEFRVRQATGAYRWMRVTAQAGRDAGGRPVHLAGCVFDVTDRKRREDELRDARDAAEAASRAKSRFLAHIGQELRSPLASLLGVGEVLKDAALAPPSAHAGEITAIIDRGGRQLAGSINEILEMARLESEQVEFHEETVVLAAILDEAIRSVRASRRETRHKLTLDLPSPLPVLSADRHRLKQVLTYVLGNAVDSSPTHGHIAVKVSRTETALEIRVEDGGPGNADEFAPSLLHPLYRLGSATARPYRGNALGLFISSVLVERHGGSLEVESRPDSGKTVHISLPAERLAAGRPMPANGSKVWRHVARNVI